MDHIRARNRMSNGFSFEADPVLLKYHFDCARASLMEPLSDGASALNVMGKIHV